MEQIETQASDLRYLAQDAPVAASDSSSAQPSPRSASLGDNSALPAASSANAGKRKAPDDGGASMKQPRSKRNRYISIACNQCKRRKIKCNGETPCQRCGNLNLECEYAPNCCSSSFKESDEFKDITNQLSRLQEQVAWLSQTASPARSLTSPVRDRHASVSSMPPTRTQKSPSTHRTDPIRPRQNSYRGPTSMAYSLDVANDTISNMGYKGIANGDDLASFLDDPPTQSVQGVGDPILEFDKDEMVRLCRVHEEEVGIMYPVLDIHSVIAHAKTLSNYLDTVRNQRSTELINDERTLQLKMVMCSALVVEEHAHSERATRLYDSMDAVINGKLMSEPANIPSLPLLALAAGYRFMSADEVGAWRVIGQVARLCIETGAHRAVTLAKIENESDRRNALNTFWTSYILDRRWAFGTGLPFVVQDEEIDPDLPFPDGYPFLKAMVSYSRIAAKVWRQVSHFGPALARDLRSEEIERLDDEILQWYESIPEDIKIRNWDQERHMISTPSYNLQRLRIWMYLRLNQIRIWLYTPILHTATSIMNNFTMAQRVVDLAKDTIQYLSHLNSTTNHYRKVPIFYHQFLTSAISAVFLASVHCPVRFSAVCRDEFYMALDLVKDLSAKSWVSKRLWRVIRSLKDIAPRFGLNPDEDPHSTAALGMIGLARGHHDTNSASSSSFQRPMIPSTAPPETPPEHNGSRIQTEMSRIYEGYVSLNGFQYQGETPISQPATELPSPESGGGVYGLDGTVFPQLREMF